MIGRLLFLFILVPLLELYILIKIGGYLGAFPTVALVVFMALLGIVLARFEGLRTLPTNQAESCTRYRPCGRDG